MFKTVKTLTRELNSIHQSTRRYALGTYQRFYSTETSESAVQPEKEESLSDIALQTDLKEKIANRQFEDALRVISNMDQSSKQAMGEFFQTIFAEIGTKTPKNANTKEENIRDPLRFVSSAFNASRLQLGDLTNADARRSVLIAKSQLNHTRDIENWLKAREPFTVKELCIMSDGCVNRWNLPMAKALLQKAATIENFEKDIQYLDSSSFYAQRLLQNLLKENEKKDALTLLRDQVDVEAMKKSLEYAQAEGVYYRDTVLGRYLKTVGAMEGVDHSLQVFQNHMKMPDIKASGRPPYAILYAGLLNVAETHQAEKLFLRLFDEIKKYHSYTKNALNTRMIESLGPNFIVTGVCPLLLRLQRDYDAINLLKAALPLDFKYQDKRMLTALKDIQKTLEHRNFKYAAELNSVIVNAKDVSQNNEPLWKSADFKNILKN
ncbi:hypothetical protein MP228_003430 [Amoeboaphelidium protococcarum]|nr:hypothetical protein MP228_003430 [Amoeboaphelidium protococcarum]